MCSAVSGDGVRGVPRLHLSGDGEWLICSGLQVDGLGVGACEGRVVD